MSTITTFTPGTLCWAELGTPDPDASKRFYNGLFDWSFRDTKIDASTTYTTAVRGGREAVGLYDQQGDEKEAGIPPHWTAYIAVASADTAAKFAEKAGGKVLVPPMDVMELGRFTVIADPSGAAIGCWEPKQMQGAGVFGEDGSLCWVELTTHDPNAALGFYPRVFGWTVRHLGEEMGNYTVFELNGTRVAGVTKSPAELQSQPSQWRIYFAVNDCDAAAAKTAKTGGSVIVPPTDIPGIGRFALLEDAAGVGFNVLKPHPPEIEQSDQE